jgi:hypothetical protein
MSRWKAITLAVFTAWPLLYMFVYWYLYIWKTPSASRTLNAET